MKPDGHTEEIKYILRRVYAKRGYLVVGQLAHHRPLAVGDVIDNVYGIWLERKFKVVSEADESDWNAHWNLVQELRPGWRREPVPGEAKYFRVVPVLGGKEAA